MVGAPPPGRYGVAMNESPSRHRRLRASREAAAERAARERAEEEAEAADLARIEREPGADRIIAFTDAAVAIALTLLVLPLMEAVSAVQESHARPHVGAWMAEHGDAIGGFFMSFVLVAVYWTMHHNAMLGVRAFRGRMLVANFTWLLGIVLLPILSDLVVAFSEDLLQKALYLGDIALIALTMLWIEFEVLRHQEAVGTEAARRIPRRLSVTLSSLVAVVVCFVLVGFTPLSWTGMFAMALIGFLQTPIAALLRRPAAQRWLASIAN